MNRAFVQAGGLLNLVFAAFHLSFPWLFQWAAERAPINAPNGKIASPRPAFCW
jgi:hypothetical protein